MQKNLTIDDIEEISQAGASAVPLPTPFDLKLITKKIPIKYCEYKISNLADKMFVSESIGISSKGILFQSLSEFKKGTLLRISRVIEYKHTEAPTYFQVLSRVLSSEEILKRGTKFQILCENLTLDSVDETILEDYLNSNGVK